MRTLEGQVREMDKRIQNRGGSLKRKMFMDGLWPMRMKPRRRPRRNRRTCRRVAGVPRGSLCASQAVASPTWKSDRVMTSPFESELTRTIGKYVKLNHDCCLPVLRQTRSGGWGSHVQEISWSSLGLTARTCPHTLLTVKTCRWFFPNA